MNKMTSTCSDDSVVLVTGGAGYIGSHTCKALAMAGYRPVTYDNLSQGHKWAVKWGPLEVGDILDRGRLDEVIIRYRPSAIIHFAAFAYVGESVTNPGKYYRNNVIGSLNLLEASRDHGIERFIFSSSCATYGVPSKLPIIESTPQNPINPYGSSKLMAESITWDFSAAHGLRSIILRYFNAAGADASCEIGEEHDPETHLIPLALDVASGRRTHLTIYGADYDTFDGSCVRDYVHVSDLAEAHLNALKALERGCPTNAYNLGNSAGFSVRQVVSTVESITGRKVVVEVGPRRLGDPDQLIASADLARRQLGWSPLYPALETMITDAWAWHQYRRRLERSA